MSDTVTRTVRVPALRLSATKAGKLARAMKDYRRARELTIRHFKHGDGDPLEFPYSERERLRKRLSRHERIDLPARTLYPAITTVEQNYAEYVKGQFDSPPTANRADTLGLEGQSARIYHTDGRYYLDVATGRGSVALPLRTSEDSWHADRLPHPDAVPPRGRSRTGVPFADLDEDDFPATTVKLSTSTLHRLGERAYRAHLVFQHRRRVNRGGGERFIIGVDRGRNQLVTAAVYDTVADHVTDWLHVGGDETEHYMDEFSERIQEFQRAGVWERMDEARERRFRYKQQRDHEAARAVVELARDAGWGVQIAVEDLSDMSRLGGYATESRRFSEWSYGRQRDYIARKADEFGIRVVAIEPAHTSQVCARCGGDATRRSGVHFECRGCGYEQHADANAAVNIAKRAADVGPLADETQPETVEP